MFRIHTQDTVFLQYFSRLFSRAGGRIIKKRKRGEKEGKD
jgi:hypothetical protein